MPRWAGLCLLAAAAPAFGQYEIRWYTIDAGGGASTGAVYSITGTIGQPDAGVMHGAGYGLTGGFWSQISVLQTPGAPTLTITLTRSNTVFVAWPSPELGWELQQSSSPDSLNWIEPPETIGDNGSTRFIIVNPPAENRFYRLIGP
jgi:hypothetical protein